jgi:hypothetical protein
MCFGEFASPTRKLGRQQGCYQEQANVGECNDTSTHQSVYDVVTRERLVLMLIKYMHMWCVTYFRFVQ